MALLLLLGLMLVWKFHTLMVSHSLMGLQAHDNTSGHLLQHFLKMPTQFLLLFCPCTNNNINWPYRIPSYIGNNYFCDSGNPGPGFSAAVYADDPLGW